MLNTKQDIPKELFLEILDENCDVSNVEMEGEVFKFIPNTGRMAAVSNLGRYKYLLYNSLLDKWEWHVTKGSYGKGIYKDYLCVDVPYIIDGKVKSKMEEVGHLVIWAFKGGPKLNPVYKYAHVDSLGNKFPEVPKFYVTHLKGKENNEVDNLKWHTWNENRHHHYHNGRLYFGSRNRAVVIYDDIYTPLKKTSSVRGVGEYFKKKGHGSVAVEDSKGRLLECVTIDGVDYRFRYYDMLTPSEQYGVDVIIKDVKLVY